MRVPFFETTITGADLQNVGKVLGDEHSFGKNSFVEKCEDWFTQNQQLPNFHLTKSCTSALELAALVLDIKPGDEIIMPSYAFVACANSFALRGATCVFVDIHPQTMNIDETLIEAAITPKTRAVLTINYSGVACNYEAIKKICAAHKLYLVEDNAHGIGAKYNNQSLGSFGDISTISFDHMKNISCGEGGGIVINNPSLLDKFSVHYESGTNRLAFFKGETNRYEWKNLGSNYRVSELNAAMLFSQLQIEQKINAGFLQHWNNYQNLLAELAGAGHIELPGPPLNCLHNGHCFFIKVKDLDQRTELLKFLNGLEIGARFHYTALHSSEFGQLNGRFNGKDVYTTQESQRLVRLPLYYRMQPEQQQFVIDSLQQFYKSKVAAKV